MIHQRVHSFVSYFFFILLSAVFFVSFVAHATPSGLTLQGRLVKDDIPIVGVVAARVSVMSPNADRCYLYEEIHSFTLSAADAGVFSLQIGAGARTANDKGFSLVQVFSNTGVVVTGLTCLGNGGVPTTYTPLAGHSRYIFLSFTTPMGAVAFNDPYVVQSVPYALEAEKLAGKSASQFLQTTAETTQDKLNDLMITSRYSDLMSLISGDSTKYMTTSNSAPTKLPVLSSTPSSPSVGQIWYENGSIRYYDADSLTVKTVGTSSGITGMSGDVSSVGVGTVTTTIGNDVVTFAKMQNITDNRILGRNAGTSGDIQEISIGTGLSLSGGVLSNSIAAPGDASYAAKGVVQFDTDAATSGITISSGIAKLANSGVSAGTYGTAAKIPQIQIDAFGRITSAASVDVTISTTAITSGVLPVARGGTGVGAFAANRVVIVSGDGSALRTDTCALNEVLQFDGSAWACVAGSSLGQGGDIKNNGNTGAVTIGTNDANSLKLETNNITAMTILPGAGSDGGNVGIGVASPLARLHLAAGSSTDGTAPLRLTSSGSGVLLSTPADGAMEYDGTKLWFTIGASRREIATTASSGNFSDVTNISNSSGSITMTPSAGNSVVINQNTSSLSSSTGALIVNGGVGVAGAINSGGAITSGGFLTSKTASSGAALIADSAAGTYREVRLQTSGSLRWDMYADTVPESGSNAGSNLYISRYADDGNYLDTALTIFRNNGNVAIAPNSGYVGIGTSSPQSVLHVKSSTGAYFNLDASTSTSADGTAAMVLKNNNSSTADIAMLRSGLPAPYPDSLLIRTQSAGSDILFSPGSVATPTIVFKSGGNVGIGLTAPTASLHLKAGTAFANTAPLKLTAGTNLTTPEDGAVEFDGTNLYFTAGGVRKTLVASGGSGGGSSSSTTNMVFNTNTDNSGSDGGFNFQANGSDLFTISNSGVVNVSSTAAATSSTTGAMTIGGGLGIGGDIFGGATINAATSMMTPQIYGANTAGGNIRIDGTSHATTGNVLLAPAGGNVGVGTTNPIAKFTVIKDGEYNSEGSPGIRILSTQASADVSLQMGVDSIRDIGFIQAMHPVTSWNTRPLVLQGVGGNVGIGTTTPQATLDVSGQIRMGTDTTTPTDGGGYVYKQSAGTTLSGYQAILETGIAGSRSTKLIVTADGNVGIGVTAPQKRIDVVSPANDFVTVGAATMGIGDWTGIHFGYRENNNSLYRKSAIVFERTDNSGAGGNAAGKVHILNGPAATSGSATLVDARLTVAELGNVGIGERNPASKLDVAGQIRPSMGTPTIDSAGNAVDFVSGNTQMATFTSCPGNALTVNLYSVHEGGSYSLIVTTPNGCVVSFTATTAAYGVVGGIPATAFKFSGGYVFPSTAEPSVYSFLRGNNIVFSSQVIDFR